MSSSAMPPLALLRDQLNDPDNDIIVFKTPPEVAVSPLCLGDNRTKAVLSSDHALLQLSTFTDDGLLFVRTVAPPAAEPGGAYSLRRLFLQSQGLDAIPGGWGLSLLTGTPHSVQSGFIDYRWPVRRAEAKGKGQGDQETLHMTTTYAEEGSIYQVIAVASPEPSAADHPVKWKLEGKVQFLSGASDGDPGEAYYSQIAQQGSPILTVGCDLDACLDIQIFVDGEPQLPPDPIQAGPQLDESSYASFSWNGELHLEAESVRFIVAIFSFRDSNKTLEAVLSPYPAPDRLRDQLGFLRAKHPLAAILAGKRSTAELIEISYIVTHHVEQLLSVAAISSPEGQLVITNSMTGNFSSTFETLFWHIRLLAKVHRLLGKPLEEEAVAYCDRVRLVLVKTAQYLVSIYVDGIDDRAFRVLSLYYALYHAYSNDIDVRTVNEIVGPIKAEFLKPQPLSPEDPTKRDSFSHLLQWCHRAILSKDAFKAAVGFQYEPVSNELEMLEYGALYEINPEAVVTELGRARAEGMQDPNIQIEREELWCKLALVQTELFQDIDGFRPFLQNLVKEVSGRLDKARVRTLGSRPPWGYRCLDHTLRMELAIASKNLGESQDGIRQAIQNAYADCSNFLLSNFSYVKSWNTSELKWSTEFWDFDCSSYVCSSLLGLTVINWEAEPRRNDDPPGTTVTQPLPSSVEGRLVDIMKGFGDIREAGQDLPKFPWKENITMRFGYPRFMTENLESRNAALDKTRLQEMIKILRLDKRAARLLLKLNDEMPLDNFPPAWPDAHLEVLGDQMYITDYPFTTEKRYGSSAEIRELFSKGRHETDSRYRMMTIDSFPSNLLRLYMFFAHPDAWETAVHYFNGLPIFRPTVESHANYTSSSDTPWLTSITIPHFILNKDAWLVDRMQEVDGSIPNYLEAPHPNAKILEVCISLCMTGDFLGEFWTLSMLGTVKSYSIRTNPQKLTSVDVVSSAKSIMEVYKYDKYSARYLVFVLGLSEINHLISRRHEDLVDDIINIMKLNTVEQLYHDIMVAVPSTSNDELFTTVTRTLRRLLWAIAVLDDIGETSRSALATLEEATRHIDKSLSTRRKYWQKSLQEFEQDRIWETNKISFSRLSELTARIGALNRAATEAKDNVVYLSNMISTRSVMLSTQKIIELTTTNVETNKAMRTTTDDTSNMKTIAILTAGFLPFTFMAILFTTPIFRWDDPKKGSVISTLPFILYWVISSVLTIIIGAFMMYILGGWSWVMEKWHKIRGVQPPNAANG